MEIWGALFCVAAGGSIQASGREALRRNWVQYVLLLTNAVLLVSDAAAWYFRGDASVLGYYMVRISNFIVFFSSYMILLLFTWYYLSETDGIDSGVVRKWKLGILIFCVMAVVLLIISQFTHLFYEFDENNYYHRTGEWWISAAIGFVGIVLDNILLIRYRKQTRREICRAFMLYSLLPILAIVIQLFCYGYSFLNFAITISVFNLFVISKSEEGRMLVMQERKLNDMRIAVMISQVKPHFLFNVLTTIRYLCKTNPDEAVKAVDEFSLYLRGNLDAISQKNCISLEKEIEHVNHYLAVERQRFGSRMRVIFEIEETGFKLPPLTLQPLVENAVKHGILKKVSGGTIVIRSERSHGGFEVSIRDDGVGFVPGKIVDDGRSHVGLINVKERLETMCHGTLKIESIPGEGTLCRIWIPENVKEKEKKGNIKHKMLKSFENTGSLFFTYF